MIDRKPTIKICNKETLMIQIRRANERGHAHHGWLNSWHTFSFSNYFDPEQIGFSDLLVINDDTVAPGRGFGAHPHDNMEIFSYVLKGHLSHQDSMGNGSTIQPGDIQLMSAGTGVVHSEMNGSKEQPVHFLQIWVMPNVKQKAPNYQQIHIDNSEKRGQLRLIISPNGEQGSLTIRQDTKIYAGLFDQDEEIIFKTDPQRYYYLHIATGRIEMNGTRFEAGDGARIRQEDSLHFSKGQNAEIILFDLRPNERPERI